MHEIHVSHGLPNITDINMEAGYGPQYQMAPFSAFHGFPNQPIHNSFQIG